MVSLGWPTEVGGPGGAPGESPPRQVRPGGAARRGPARLACRTVLKASAAAATSPRYACAMPALTCGTIVEGCKGLRGDSGKLPGCGRRHATGRCGVGLVGERAGGVVVVVWGVGGEAAGAYQAC